MDRTLRDRVLRVGPTCLDETELVSVALGCGVPRARRLLDRIGGLHRLSLTDSAELRAARLLEPEALRLLAVVELARRLFGPEDPRAEVHDAKAVHALLAPRMVAEDREHLVVVSLNRRNRVLAVDTVAVGNAHHTILDPSMIYQTALRRGAAAIVIAHNHPTGDPTPSMADITATQALDEVGRAIQIPLLDHLVITRQDFWSMATMLHLRGIDVQAILAA